MKIALIQSNPVTGALNDNMQALLEAVRVGAGLGADLCVAPALALCGHNAGDLLLLSGFAADCRAVLEQAAADLGRESSLPPLLLGAPVANPVPQGKTLQSCAVLLDRGKVSVVGRKVLLPTDGVHEDARYFEPGVGCGLLQIKGWRLCVTVGEDVWNDRTFWKGRRSSGQDPVADFMAAGGADGLINLTALPFEGGMAALHQRMLGHLAARYRVPLAAVNMVGGNDSLVYYGGSLGFARDGSLKARAPCFEEAVLLVDMAGREAGEIAEEGAAEEKLWQAMVLGTRDFVRKCGFSSVVVGLSGGVDSALVAAIAVEAFGPDKVTALLMPSAHSSAGSIEDAQLLAANLGIQSHILPITPVFEAGCRSFEQAFSGPLKGLARENIQARIRCSLLMAYANSFGAMLLATGNKSEAAVGYTTLYGDLSGVLAPIGDLYKEQVYSVCRLYNDKHPGAIPQAILDKAPSAELAPDQKDEDSLPPYPVLDALLRDIVDNRDSLAGLLEKGHDPELAASVLAMTQRAEFKRHQAPPALHLSAKGFGAPSRMPVVAVLNSLRRRAN